MGTLIYFEDGNSRCGIIRFVKNFRKKNWFRKERIDYTLSCIDGNPFIEPAIVDLVCARVKKDFPHAKVYCTDYAEFHSKYYSHRFWIICNYGNNDNHHLRCVHDGSSDISYFSYVAGKRVVWTTDLDDMELHMDQQSAQQSADNIRRLCGSGAMVYVSCVYLNLENMLLTPIMMLTCTSKRGKEETKYFARLEGNRIRLVNTSDAARKFTYTEVFEMFEHLQTRNKNFKYAVLPVFKDNVHCRNLEEYIREKKVSRMIQMTAKLKWLNR